MGEVSAKVLRKRQKTPGRQPRRRIRNETRIRRRRRKEGRKKKQKKIKRKEDMHPFLPALVKGLERAREGHPVEFKEQGREARSGWVGGGERGAGKKREESRCS